MVTYLSAGFSCTFCESYAPTHNNGKFKYVVIFSQTGEWGMCCEKCATKGAEDETSIDSWFYQDDEGKGYKFPFTLVGIVFTIPLVEEVS